MKRMGTILLLVAPLILGGCSLENMWSNVSSEAVKTITKEEFNEALDLRYKNLTVELTSPSNPEAGTYKILTLEDGSQYYELNGSPNGLARCNAEGNYDSYNYDQASSSWTYAGEVSKEDLEDSSLYASVVTSRLLEYVNYNCFDYLTYEEGTSSYAYEYDGSNGFTGNEDNCFVGSDVSIRSLEFEFEDAKLASLVTCQRRDGVDQTLKFTIYDYGTTEIDFSVLDSLS